MTNKLSIIKELKMMVSLTALSFLAVFVIAMMANGVF